jgi:hypothetical protein
MPKTSNAFNMFLLKDANNIPKKILNMEMDKQEVDPVKTKEIIENNRENNNPIIILKN